MLEIKKYIKWLQKKNLAQSTITNYPVTIRQFSSRTLNTTNIINHIKEVSPRYEPGSLRNKIIALNSYAKFKKAKIAWERITQLIPKVQQKYFATINNQELEQLKNARFEENDLTYERNNLLLDFLFYIGLRVGELTNLKHSDYGNGILKVLGKGNKVRWIFVPEWLTINFHPYQNGYLFTNRQGNKLSVRIIERIITKRTQLAGIQKRITPHSLRRSFATNLYNRGGKLETIQKQLRHTSLDTTMAYIHNDYETLYADYSKLWKSSETLKNYAN